MLTATLLMVLGLNHQAVATLRVLPDGAEAQVAAAPRTAVIKQRVTLEATSPLDFCAAAITDAWFPQPLRLPTAPVPLVQSRIPRVRPSALPNYFRARLLRTALSPQAP